MNRELQNMSEESLQNLEEIVETELLTVEDIRERLDTTEKGKIRQSIQNCKYVLEHDPCLKGAICRNEMTCQIDIMKKMPWKRRGVHMTDTDMNNLALYLEKNYGLTSDRVIAKAIDIVANENSFHPILEYLENLKWDGIPRIQHMLTHFFGAEDIQYTGEVMKMHMMVLSAGCMSREPNMTSCSAWSEVREPENLRSSDIWQSRMSGLRTI